MRRAGAVRALARLLRGSDVALVYAGAVLVVAVVVLRLPAEERARIVLECSTNIANLRRSPLRVLVASAAVVQGASDLLLLVPLVVAATAATRWFGRGACVVALVFGHVFATLGVAVLIAAGLHRGVLDPSLARASDVGPSYALAGVAGLLPAHLRGWWRAGYLLAAAGLLAALLVHDPDFTEVGHVLAFAIGGGLAVVARGAAAPPAAPPARSDRSRQGSAPR